MNNIQLDFQLKASINEEYKIKSIQYSIVYAKMLITKPLLGFYYLIT